MVELLPQFKYVVVWEFATAAAQVQQFVAFGKNMLHARVQFIEDVPVKNWPERTDVVFAVHMEDIWPFIYSRPRFPSMSWIEDAIRRHPEWYPDYLNSYRRY